MVNTMASLPSPLRAQYPWTGRTLPVGPRGLGLHHLDVGEGEPLLMVHGNPTWSWYYRHLVHALSDERRCIVPDHIGCGLSDKPLDWSYRLADHVDNLSELVEHLDLQDATLVVHDWGGPIGLLTALRHAHRFKRLVLFNTAFFLGPLPPEIRICRHRPMGELLIQGMNGFVRGLLVRATAQRGLTRTTAGRGYLWPYDSWDARVANLRFVQDIPMEPDHPTRGLIEELSERISELAHLPTQMIWGEQDFVFTTDFLARARQNFPDAEVHSFSDAGHLVIEDAHERIVPLMRDFFSRHPVS